MTRPLLGSWTGISIAIFSEVFYGAQAVGASASHEISHMRRRYSALSLNLFLDIVPSFFADITRALRGCFRGGSVYVSFRFVSKQKKTFNSVGKSFVIF